MLELIAPAGSVEAVIAAVQNGADTVYMAQGLTALGSRERAFDRDELARSIRYCRVRGCRAAASIPSLRTDENMGQALELALFAAREGVDALIVRDLGLVSVLRRALPDMPLWGDVRLGVTSAEGAAAAAALGLRRIFLAPELSMEQIAAIARTSPVPTAVYVHGPVCVAHGGQCYIGALAHEHKSDNCMRCDMPCRGRFSLGGRMDEHPLAMADVYLMEHLEALETMGVAGAVIEGRGRRPEYVAYTTRLYARALREKLLPTEEEKHQLLYAFNAAGLSDGYYTGEAGPGMFAPAPAADRTPPRFYTELRKRYTSGELRRVPVKFYAVLRPGEPALFGVEDDRGHRAAVRGYEPIDLGRQGVTEARIREILYRTGGTPFNCVQVKCAIAPDLDYPDEAVESARRELLGKLADMTRAAHPAAKGDLPPKPTDQGLSGPPKLIVQVTRPDQLTAELAAMAPDLLYVPAEILAAGSGALAHFLDRGAQIVAALPRVVSEAESPVLRELLAALRDRGVTQALVNNLGLLPAVRQAGMEARGDLGLNAANSWALQFLDRCGLKSVTASCELTARQIGALVKPVDTEMVVYGRLPVMVTEHCVIRNSAGRCSCATPTSMSDTFGSVYPVEKEFGCRNTVYDARKTFLADHPETYTGVGLWGARLLFTTESPRECVQVTRRYKGESDYLPTNASRGAYQKGAL